MTTENPPVAKAGATAAATRRPSAAPSWRWRRGALFLAGAAQLITISALTSADPVPATWSALLLAVAPAPLAAAAFAPAPVNRLALAAAAVAIIVGGAGQITHTGLFFVPALVVLVIAGAMLWLERS